jgi:H/ACA ribonucleoprotein complex subunit 4
VNYIHNLVMPQLQNLTKIDDDITDEAYGHYPDLRPISSLLDYGLILIDKPAGPSSHEIVAWIKKILCVQSAGHSGTLDPGATGLLPIGLGEGTKALSILLLGPKEYYTLARMHSHISEERLQSVLAKFTGEIFQRPPQRSSVKRSTRIRTIYEFQKLEQYDRLALFRILCQAGTYIRKVIYDIGEVLGPGATMIELRRTRVSNLAETNSAFTKLHDLEDGFQIYKAKNDDKKLRHLIRPIEQCLEGLRAVVVRDTAVDALCHGAQLAVPGIVAVAKDLAPNQLVGIYTIKGEIIGLGESLMSIDDIQENGRGIAVHLKRIILKPNTYPRAWRPSGKDRLKGFCTK